MAESVMMERRITLRLLGYWEKLRGLRAMPAAHEVSADDIQDLWDSCMLIDVRGQGGYVYHYMAPSIVEIHYGGAPEGEKRLAASGHDLLTPGCAKVVESGCPLLDEGEFRSAGGELVKYRLCLLPLGEEGQVQAILGGMRFKRYPG